MTGMGSELREDAPVVACPKAAVAHITQNKNKTVFMEVSPCEGGG